MDIISLNALDINNINLILLDYSNNKQWTLGG